MSRSTWACELKYLWPVKGFVFWLSRSTWACELKLAVNMERNRELIVTLHVSVWVEIFAWFICLFAKNVTLHVSVWVEIQYVIRINHYPRHAPRERVSWNSLWQVRPCLWLLSRSTWACELKSSVMIVFWCVPSVTLHVSVWVEISSVLYGTLNDFVTLHVSVWVEIYGILGDYFNPVVTLHVSVWVEI